MRVYIEPGGVVLEQHGPVFLLPLELELVTATGRLRRAVQLNARSDTLDVSGLGSVTDVLVDPDHRLLKRHNGEVVRFELRAPEAKRVELQGNFTSSPIPATREGDVWRVAVPLSAGRYAYFWNVDGKSTGSDLRVVQPLHRLETSFPR